MVNRDGTRASKVTKDRSAGQIGTPHPSRLLYLTPDLEAAMVRAYYCCREVGSCDRTDYEAEANQAADCIAMALRSMGVHL